MKNRIKVMRENRIGLFGGTFNPVHLGHLTAVDIVQKRFSLDKVLFIPSYIPPHKESDDIASPVHRLRMIELAIASFPRFIPSSLEIEAKEKSYSIITLNKIRKIYPRTLIFFILGIDAFLEIETWKDYKLVLQKCFFIVMSRPNYDLEGAKSTLSENFSNSICRLSESEQIGEDKLSSFKIFLMPIKALDIASTEVREKVRKGNSVTDLIPEEVNAYIKENKLYM